MKKKIKFLLKLLFGIIILVFLFSKTSVQDFLHLLGSANYKFFIAALLLYITGQVISSKKWMVLAQRLNFDYPFSQYLRWYFLGMFYNTFLPTNIGGDVVKIAKINDENPHTYKRAIISVFSDRMTGFYILSFFIFMGSIFYHYDSLINCFNFGIISAVLIVTILFVILIKNPKIIPEKYKTIYDFVKLLCDKFCIIKITILSLLFHVFLIVIHYCIARMYGMNIPVLYYLLLYPIAAIIASLPVSINGVGIKELVYVYMLKQFSIDTSSAILFAMTFNMVALFSNLIGFIPYIGKDKK